MYELTLLVIIVVAVALIYTAEEWGRRYRRKKIKPLTTHGRRDTRSSRNKGLK